LVPQVWRSLDVNPIAVSLLRKRPLQLECAFVESRCAGGISGAVSNKGNVTMPRKIMLRAAVAAIGAFAFAPAPALAHGDRVSVKDSYMPGTILTNPIMMVQRILIAPSNSVNDEMT
jgi:hypothetical protein